MEFTPIQYLCIFLICVISKGYGTITGGGSVLLQPMLIAFGVPAHLAVTHDIAATNGSFLASFMHFRNRSLIRYNLAWYSLPGIFLGSFLGVYLLTLVSVEFVENFIAVLALCLLFFTLFFNKKTGIEEHPLPEHAYLSLPLFGFVLGVYMTFSGLGTGTFASLILTSVFGTTFIQSIALRPVIQGFSSFLAIFAYAAVGMLLYDLLLVMLFGCAAGGYLGARFSVYVSQKLLKNIFAVAVVVFAGYLLLK